MGNKYRIKTVPLILVAWFAVLIEMPIFGVFFIRNFVNPAADMGPSHASPADLVIMAAGPLVACAALATVLRRGSLALWRRAEVLIPVLLSAAESVCLGLLWMAG